ncbi:sugar efflux transporter for intercellular exchange-domain-containing protein [Haematococcus lacustris]|nr:hypothetical protein QJQ45_020841 [Haematococcus lacustris]
MQSFDKMDADDWKSLALNHLAPGLGCIIAFLMFVSPLRAVQNVRKLQSLGDLNPLPLVAIIANCMVWLIYGSFTRDIYVVSANQPGLLLGVYMTASTLGVAGPQMRDLMLRALMFFATLISVTSVSICLWISDPAQQVQAAGYQAVGVLLLYYSAPLSTLAEVLRTRSAASLHAPLSAMSCVNGSLWVAYGLAVGDAFIWAPNAVGAVFGALQLLLLAIFPRTSSAIAVLQHDIREPLVDA